jgi:hypothetical protein
MKIRYPHLAIDPAGQLVIIFSRTMHRKVEGFNARTVILKKG